MSEIQVVQVGQDRKLRKQFLNLPWELYKGDPNWVPPLRRNQAELVNFYPHPFYESNSCSNFLALKNGQPAGRITAIINRGHNERYKEKRGFFGFFESVDDDEVAHALFRNAGKYLAAEGMTDVRGPTNVSLNHDLGTLVEGFDSPPTFMMTYNPPYHEQLITSFGFEKCQDLYAFEGHISMIANLDPKLEFVIKEIKRRFNVNVRPFNTRKFKQEVDLFIDIYNKSLISTWGFVPMSRAEAAHQAAGLQHLLVPELTSIIEVDGKPIGAGLGLLDFNPVIKKIDGRLFPFGFIKLLMSKRRLKRVRLMSTNVLPEFQKWGFGLLALERMLEDILRLKITTGEFSWVLESNHLSRASLERSGLDRNKTYRLYDRSLADF